MREGSVGLVRVLCDWNRVVGSDLSKWTSDLSKWTCVARSMSGGRALVFNPVIADSSRGKSCICAVLLQYGYQYPRESRLRFLL